MINFAQTFGFRILKRQQYGLHLTSHMENPNKEDENLTVTSETLSLTSASLETTQRSETIPTRLVVILI